MRNVGFLFLSPATHIDHAMPIACELQGIPGHQVTVFVATEPVRKAVEDAEGFYPKRPPIEFLQPSAWQRFLGRFKKRPHPALSDMTYTGAADVYLGDVSSQVYEFVAYRERPCVFLDVHGVDWRGNGNLRMWRMGPVLAAIEQLPAAMANVPASFAAHVEAQRARVAETFSITDVPAGRRGAEAIAQFLARRS